MVQTNAHVTQYLFKIIYYSLSFEPIANIEQLVINIPTFVALFVLAEISSGIMCMSWDRAREMRSECDLVESGLVQSSWPLVYLRLWRRQLRHSGKSYANIWKDPLTNIALACVETKPNMSKMFLEEMLISNASRMSAHVDLKCITSLNDLVIKISQCWLNLVHFTYCMYY